jgi:uncharacterized protein (UPF0261 family)
MHVQRYSKTVTTDASGDAEEYTDQVNGYLSQIRYVKPGSGGYADTVDFTITSEETGETLWAQENVTASATVAPRQAVHSTAGAALLYATDGEPVTDKIAVTGRIKIVIANGGNGGTGTFHFTMEGAT